MTSVFRKTRSRPAGLRLAALLALALSLGACAPVTQIATSSTEAATVRQTELARNLYELAYSDRQSALFVVSAGSGRVEPIVPPRIYRLNPETLEAQAHIDLPRMGTGLALDDGNGRLYVSSPLDASVSVLDTRSNALVATLQLAQGSRVVILDARTGRLVHSAAVPEGPLALHLDAAHGLLYVTHRLAGTVSVLDSRTLSMLHSYALPEHPNSLSMDASGSTLFVTVKNDMTTGRLRDETVARIPAPL